MSPRVKLWLFLAALLAASFCAWYWASSAALEAGCAPAYPGGRVWTCPTPTATP